ncbi:hypothetical protein [Alteriqipengyuania sp.]|uniref:hypothetical protein n=1 Tax=Alteriqipengyuania sp. TaxID=2800692 RepID=UPI0035116C42
MPKMLVAILLWGLVISPAHAQRYTGGLEEVTEVLNSNPQIKRDVADDLHARSVRLRASAAEIEEYCAGEPSARRQERCAFAQGVLLNSVIRLMERVRKAKNGEYEKRWVPEDPRCAVARHNNSPEFAEHMGADCDFEDE